MGIWEIVGLMGFGVAVTLLAVLLGAFIAFKSTHAVPGERFLGGAPKGQVFTIPEAEEAEDFPEEKILENSERFLKMFGGGK